MEKKKRIINRISNHAAIRIIALSATLPAAALAGIQTDTVLQFDPGVRGGYYGQDVVGGSYFAIDFNGDGTFSKNERTPLVMNEGVIVGAVQPASGSHSGFPDGTETPSIDEPWPFFANTGMTQTTSTVTVADGDDGTGDGIATLDFSGWSITWNGIPNIPMGGTAEFSDTSKATVNCSSSCDPGENYTLDYFAHVPSGDPSGFGGVHYTVHLEGTIGDGTPPPPTRSIAIQLGNNQVECTAPNQGVVDATLNAVTSDPNDIVSVDWTLDGVFVGSGTTINTAASLGDHILAVTVATQQSGIFTKEAAFSVQDRVSPTLDIVFRDRRSDAVITEITKRGKSFVMVDFVTADDCDSSPVATGSATPVHSVNDGDTIVIKNHERSKVVIDTTAIRVTAEAVDASGNRRQAASTLLISD